MKPLIEVRNLHVSFAKGTVRAVRGISFDLGREKLGIVGESGSGKSMTGRAIMQLLPPSASVTADKLTFGDVDLLKARESELIHIRGRRIGLIMQDPKYSLNPVVSIGQQIAETYRLHTRSAGKREAWQAAIDMLAAVQIRDPAHVMTLYPHQVSGGMGQRVMIAMMLVGGPEVLIADEPTSALDVTVRVEILNLLDKLVTEKSLGLMFISHDLNLVRRFCDRVVIMYAGRIVEELPAADLDKAEHPYTRGLLAAVPSIHHPRPRLSVLKRDPSWSAA